MIKKYDQFIFESNIDGRLFGINYQSEFEKKLLIDSICKKYRIKNYTINPDGTVDVYGSVSLYNKNLTALPLKFGNVTSDFDCGCNYLTNLVGSPKVVGGYFNCSYNELTSLEDSPNIIDGSFACQGNKLTSLKGAPDKVNGSFSCFGNNLISFKYLPLANDYSFGGNPIYEFLQYFNHYFDKKNLGEYLKLFEDIVQYPYLDDLEFEELAKSLKLELPENWRDSVKSYKMLSKF